MRDMFIENPHKKTTYSFRIKPDLLEDIKAYAKATNTTVPELLNTMIEEKVEDLHLTNDYLDINLDCRFISLPSLTEMYNNGEYKEFDLFNEVNSSVIYEIQKVPNNLDVWGYDKGYRSIRVGTKHEGISFVLAPELITKPEYLENPDLLLCCLIPIHVILAGDNSITLRNRSLKEAFQEIEVSENSKLLSDFKELIKMVETAIRVFTSDLKEAKRNPDGTYNTGGATNSFKQTFLKDSQYKLISELELYCEGINTDIVKYVVNLDENGIDGEPNEPLLDTSLFTEEITKTREEIKEKDKVIEELQAELDEVKEKQEKIMGMFKEYINLSNLIEGKYDEYNRSK